MSGDLIGVLVLTYVILAPFAGMAVTETSIGKNLSGIEGLSVTILWPLFAVLIMGYGLTRMYKIFGKMIGK